MGNTIKLKKVASVMNSAISIWPKEDTPCYAYRDTKFYEIRLACVV